MGRLVKDGKVGYKSLDVRDDKGVRYTTEGYYRTETQRAAAQ